MGCSFQGLEGTLPCLVLWVQCVFSLILRSLCWCDCPWCCLAKAKEVIKNIHRDVLLELGRKIGYIFGILCIEVGLETRRFQWTSQLPPVRANVRHYPAGPSPRWSLVAVQWKPSAKFFPPPIMSPCCYHLWTRGEVGMRDWLEMGQVLSQNCTDNITSAEKSLYCTSYIWN